MMKAFFLLLLSVCMVGCGVDATFPGRDPDQLWRALKAVAEQPEYGHQDPTKEWTLVENVVRVDEELRRIDIDRRVKRLLHRPRTKDLYEDVHWSFQVQQYPTDPPSVHFQANEPELPTKVQFEGDRYFTEVRFLLSGLPRPQRMRTPVVSSDSDVNPSP